MSGCPNLERIHFQELEDLHRVLSKEEQTVNKYLGELSEQFQDALQKQAEQESTTREPGNNEGVGESTTTAGDAVAAETTTEVRTELEPEVGGKKLGWSAYIRQKIARVRTLFGSMCERRRDHAD